jgi:holo-[acyl-carrier protein] synthase
MGIGTDIIEISRIKSVMLNHGERFVNRILTDEERAYCMSMAHPDKHIAARFAAKEAVSKCFTTGIGSELGWKSVSVYHGTRHEPLVRLDQQGQALLKHVGATHILLTLSHTDNYAMAVAALVRS